MSSAVETPVLLRAAALGALTLLAGCVAPKVPPPAPRPVQHTPAIPPAEAPLVQSSEDWRDLPLTPGRWRYQPGATPTSTFGGIAPLFAIRCDLGQRLVSLQVVGGGTGVLSIQTSAGLLSWPATGGAVSLRAGDPALDKIAFSRGRFVVTLVATTRLVIPAWPEFARVVEDCRG